MRKRRITTDIFQLLPPEAVNKVDELGYNFLTKQGFQNASKAMKDKTARRRLKAELKARQCELKYSSLVDKSNGQIVVWFELFENGKLVKKSSAIKFIPKMIEGG